MPDKIYLDAHGNEVPTGGKVYLDEHGNPLSPAAAPGEPASLGGFLENVLSSGENAVSGLYGAGKMAAGVGLRAFEAQFDPAASKSLADDATNLVRHLPDIGSAALQGLKNRYGSWDAIKNTLYTDPVGAGMDAATALDGVGLAGKAAGLTKVADIAGKASEVANPIAWAGKAVKPVLGEAANGIVATAVRPSAALREDFGGGRAIAQSIIKHGVTSAADADQKLTRSYQATDEMLRAADDARPDVAGYLPAPKQEVPLGRTPQPGGGQAAVTDAPASMRRVNVEAVPAPDRGTLDGLVSARNDLGAGSKALPDARIGFSPREIEIADQLGEQSRLAPTRSLLGDGQPGGTRFEPQFLSDGGEATGDQVAGPGVLLRDNPSAAPGGVYARGAQPGVHISDLVRSLAGDPMDLATKDIKLGVPGAIKIPEQIRDRISDLMTQYPSGVIPFPEAQALKRRAQDLAYEAQQAGLSVAHAQNKGIAVSLRRGIEEGVPSVGPQNVQSQELLGAQRAMAVAEDRPSALTKTLAIGAAGMNPTVHGLLAPALMMGLDSPRLGAPMGIALSKLGTLAGNPQTARAALLARLADLAGASQ